MWHEILAGVYLRGLAIFFSFAGTYFCDFKEDWFFLLGINFCDFQKVQDKSLIIFRFYQERVKMHIFYTTVCIPCVKLVKQIAFLCHSF